MKNQAKAASHSNCNTSKQTHYHDQSESHVRKSTTSAVNCTQHQRISQDNNIGQETTPINMETEQNQNHMMTQADATNTSDPETVPSSVIKDLENMMQNHNSEEKGQLVMEVQLVHAMFKKMEDAFNKQLSELK